MVKQYKPYFKTKNNDFCLYKGDTRILINELQIGSFDMIFADPPYFLSNGGISVQAGRQVCVNKGDWDKSHGVLEDKQFNYEWINGCRRRLNENGTIWICGTFHNIFSVASVLSELNFRILNAVTWQKSNPPPNLSCRFFTHSTEMIVWARKSKKTPHYYNYDLMHKIAGRKQMTDVWRLPAIAPWEKSCGKHPTQKPLNLLCRAILASTVRKARILDPFTGSSTTGIAANLLGREFVGIDNNESYLELSVARRKLLPKQIDEWVSKLPDLSFASDEVAHSIQ